jgi:CBS domain-containing protein
MSPRAAWRLESLGFTRVYDYAPGKADWAASGRPVEGTLASEPRVGPYARTDIPTCGLDERVADVAARTRRAGWNTCLVVNESGVVLGRLFRKELDAGGDTRAEDAMRPGPVTFRPNVTVEEMAHYLSHRDMKTALVTRPDGTLIGLFRDKDDEGGDP